MEVYRLFDTMNPKKLDIEIANHESQLETAMQAVEGFLGECGIQQDVAFRVILAVEELVTNSMKYGYDDDNPHTISISVCIQDTVPEEIVLLVQDDGHPFDPQDAPTPDLESAPEDRQIGGLGLHLVKQMSQGLEYERMEPYNRVRVTFRT
ncbi:MAG TPA: hypothetical protein DEW46_07505 [Verrucomicrobia bacterium]|jgi:anti-sigma regulatory factor (Ser/Thr protein kinase)|nr:hypothetical protein [Verrucomicrobiota bacterium]